MPIESALCNQRASRAAVMPEPQPPQTSVTFGAVTVKVTPPTPGTVQRNIEAGQAALRQARNALVKPGVKISRPKGQPLYFGSSEHPDLIIREVNGSRTFGKFTGGKFRIVKNTRQPVAANEAKAARKA